MKTIVFIVLLAIVGVVVGYFLFGKVGNNYVQITTLLNPPQGGLARLGQKILGVEKIRQNILIAGSVGAVVGLLASVAGKRPRR